MANRPKTIELLEMRRGKVRLRVTYGGECPGSPDESTEFTLIIPEVRTKFKTGGGRFSNVIHFTVGKAHLQLTLQIPSTVHLGTVARS